MKRFSSEGSLLDLDFLPWRRVAKPPQKDPTGRASQIYPVQPEQDEPDGSRAEGRSRLSREHSVSAENLDQSHLQVHAIGSRAYSDGQLAGAAQETERDPTQAGGPGRNPGGLLGQNKHAHRPRLAAAKLHLKSLFGQSPHSSNSNLTEQKDASTERRSRLLFMRQWSQAGHGQKGRVCRAELLGWSRSLDVLLSSQVGVSVFGSFLRTEFAEENLQFLLACAQYRHSSHNFSLQRRAKEIGSTYIQPGAPREVNLDSKTRDLTMQLLKAPSHNSLSHAEKRIYSLLDLDCYPRFLQSQIYRALLKDAT